MIEDRHRQDGAFVVGDDDLEEDLATLITAFRDMAHPVSSSLWEAGPADGRDSAGQRGAASRAPAVPPSRRDAWGTMFEAAGA